MNRRFARAHLSDQVVLSSATANAARERASTADLLADLAEIDQRRLYVPLAYPSTLAYCMGELRLGEQAALKRIRAARVARRFPAVFEAVAAGRLNLTAVVLLAPHLTEDTAGELLSSATHKSKLEIEQLLAERFPKADVLAWIAPTSPVATAGPSAPAQAEVSPGTVESLHEVAKVTPLSSQSCAVQFTMSRSAHEKLRYAQTLLGRRIASGDLGQVFEQALDAWIPQLEKRRFAATTRPPAGHRRRSSSNPRYVPAHVQRAVWQRDGGQCTFVSETGHRCEAREDLEYDHILEVARGGEATVDGIRLRCRAHNQFQAERTFGPEFMRHKRIAAAEARAAARAARAQAASDQAAVEPEEELDVVPALRQLGYNAAETRYAAARCKEIPDATIEDRVRFALSCLRIRCVRVGPDGERLETASGLVPKTASIVHRQPGLAAGAGGC